MKLDKTQWAGSVLAATLLLIPACQGGGGGTKPTGTSKPAATAAAKDGDAAMDQEDIPVEEDFVEADEKGWLAEIVLDI